MMCELHLGMRVSMSKIMVYVSLSFFVRLFSRLAFSLALFISLALINVLNIFFNILIFLLSVFASSPVFSWPSLRPASAAGRVEQGGGRAARALAGGGGGAPTQAGAHRSGMRVCGGGAGWWWWQCSGRMIAGLAAGPDHIAYRPTEAICLIITTHKANIFGSSLLTCISTMVSQKCEIADLPPTV